VNQSIVTVYLAIGKHTRRHSQRRHGPGFPIIKL